jgi:hypothetical protein
VHRGLPSPRQQLGQAAYGMGGDAGEDVSEIREGIDVVTLATGN